MTKIEAALQKYERILRDADRLFGKVRDVRYRSILETQKRFAELQTQSDSLVSIVKPIQSNQPAAKKE